MTPKDIRDTAIPKDVMEAATDIAGFISTKGDTARVIACAIMAATEAERERCASVADEFSVHWGLAYKTMTDQIAAAIRAGKNGASHD